MLSNAETILRQILQDKKQEIAPEMSDEDFFEFFIAEQVTKDFELSYEEISDGIVDGEHDGGIDSIFTFVDGELIGDDVAIPASKKTCEIELIIVQSKSKSGFSETPINNLISSLSQLLSLQTDIDSLTQYNSSVREKARIFRETFKRLTSKFPTLRISVYYACGSANTPPHPNTAIKASELEGRLKELFHDASIKFNFLGPQEINSIAGRRPSETFELNYETALNGKGGYIALVTLPNFYRFLCANGERIRSDLFDANVRDHQGTTTVNSDIAKTLNEESEDDFWWLNNGVTIIASKTQNSFKVLTVQNPQIVNGRLCCTNRLNSEFPLSLNGLIPQLP